MTKEKTYTHKITYMDSGEPNTEFCNQPYATSLIEELRMLNESHSVEVGIFTFPENKSE